jgi:hypothetical protein
MAMGILVPQSRRHAGEAESSEDCADSDLKEGGAGKQKQTSEEKTEATHGKREAAMAKMTGWKSGGGNIWRESPRRLQERRHREGAGAGPLYKSSPKSEPAGGCIEGQGVSRV